MQIGDLLEVRFFCTSDVQTSINVRHYSVTDITGAGMTAAQIAAALGAIFGPLYKNLMSGSGNFYGTGVRKIQPIPIGLEAFSTAGQGPGIGTGEILPRQVSGLISLITNFGGRSYKGRLYVPYPGETANGANSVPDPAYMTPLSVLADALVAGRALSSGADANYLTPVVWSRALNITTQITARKVSTKWATMRSRGHYGRANSPPF